MSIEILAGIFILFSMAALGAPVAYAILSGIIVYLGVAGQDLAIAGQTMVQRLFDGFLLLAVPLFIVTANIMNAGTISDRLLNFCVAVVGRFRGGLGHVNVMASLIFSGMSPDKKLPEIVEIPDHPWFVAVQFHPELKSKPFDPHPLFKHFVSAAVYQSRLV